MSECENRILFPHMDFDSLKCVDLSMENSMLDCPEHTKTSPNSMTSSIEGFGSAIPFIQKYKALARIESLLLYISTVGQEADTERLFCLVQLTQTSCQRERFPMHRLSTQPVQSKEY